MLIENSMLAMINESDANFQEQYKVIYDFSIDVETENIAHEVDITRMHLIYLYLVLIHMDQ